MKPRGSTEIDARTLQHLLTELRKGTGKGSPGFQCLGKVLESGNCDSSVSREQKLPEGVHSLLPKLRCTQKKQEKKQNCEGNHFGRSFLLLPCLATLWIIHPISHPITSDKDMRSGGKREGVDSHFCG